jgi:choline monooxygenase
MGRPSVSEIVAAYNPDAPLAEAWTLPAPWYLDPRVLDLERRTVFSRSWQMVGRAEQVREPGQFFSCEVAGEPILVVWGSDNVLRGFFNVCRHHAAAVVSEPEGCAQQLRCPYHGWTYALEGQPIGVPDFAGVRDFDYSAHGLVSLDTALWQGWVFAKVERGGASLAAFLSTALNNQIQSLGLDRLHWAERRRYKLNCNWKVFVDNYLDGGYHVPHLHGGLSSVLDNRTYTNELGERFCFQSSAMVADGADPATSAVRRGGRASYYWIYPNFMINYYQGVMDTNLVLSLGTDRTEVIFDYYFSDLSAQAREQRLASIAVSERIQNEDVAICESVQRGLSSRAYTAGRLSARREGGEHLFHRLLYADLKGG